MKKNPATTYSRSKRNSIGKMPIDFAPKIVVPADAFNNFENEKLSKYIRSRSNSFDSNSSKKTNEDINEKDKSNVIVTADRFNSFEEVVIKNESIVDDKDKVKNSQIKTEVGEQPDNKISASVSEKPSKPPAVNKVFIIKNLSGKSVTLIPKSKPVLLNKNVPEVINISELNPSQKFFTPPETTKKPQIEHKQPFTIKDFNNMPLYVDNHCQTDFKRQVKNISCQTDVYVAPPVASTDEVPDIADLMEYLLDTPKYSSGIDEIRKSDLIGMSKNIAMKGKNGVEDGKSGKVNVVDLKRQLFLDLRECISVDFWGNKPIHNAVLENNVNLLQRQCFALRLRKFSVDVENNQGQTALQMAVVNNSISEIISILLGNGSKVDVNDKEGNTLLHLVVMNSEKNTLELIMKYCLHLNTLIDVKNDAGLTPLMLASIESKSEMVDLLLQNGADPNARDEKSGRTALFHAVELNCNYVINLLLKHKADPKVRNFFGLTALDAAKDLEMPEANILETGSSFASSNGNATASGTKRGGGRLVQTYEPAKKSKLSFVSSYQKVEISTIQKAQNRKRKKNVSL